LDPAVALWRVINSTVGVARLVAFEACRRQIMQTALVESNMARCDSEECVSPLEEIAAGIEVPIPKVPFAYFVREVVAAAPGARIWSMLELMGHETSVHARVDAVERACAMP
jgi:hypothetical protein